MCVTEECAVVFIATTPKDCSPTLSPLNAFSRSMDNASLSRSVEQLSSPLDAEPIKRHKYHSGGSGVGVGGGGGGGLGQQQHHQPLAPQIAPQTVHSRSSATRGGTWGSISR